MAQRTTGQRFRQRKLSTKQNLAIVREHQLEDIAEDEAQRHVPKVETGVEKGEETEHHLQAIISAAQVAAVGGKVAQLYIPTPEAVKSKVQYAELYSATYRDPATYIRFSSTVEDCSGCPYTMDSEDFPFLKALNQKQGKPGCSEDDFEWLMNTFEGTAALKQPYAGMSNAPVLSFEEMHDGLRDEERISDECRKLFAKDVYEHWRTRRLAKGNRPISPALRFEQNVETDDSDPYVCFRRREVRQTRKTRGRDAQATEKVNKMRREMEVGRSIVQTIQQKARLDLTKLQNDKAVFELRVKLRDAKRALNIKEGDELLINQKPVQRSKPKMDPNMATRGPPGQGMKAPLPRADGRPADSDLIQLEDQKTKRYDTISHFIEDNLNKHQEWNKGYVDATWRPLTPPFEGPSRSTFRPAVVELLPTPPTSEGEMQDVEMIDGPTHSLNKMEPFVVKYETPHNPPWEPSDNKVSFRRRTGRGGRLMIDRRGLRRIRDEIVQEGYSLRSRGDPLQDSQSRSNYGRAPSYDRSLPKRFMSDFAAQRLIDRSKYDVESDEDDELYVVDPHEVHHMKYRIMMDNKSAVTTRELHARDAARRNQESYPNQIAHSRSMSGQHSVAPP